MAAELFHGTQAVPEQIVNTYFLHKSVPRLLTSIYSNQTNQVSKDLVDQMLRGYKVCKTHVTKTTVIFLGSPITRPPTPREAHLLSENGINVHQRAFYQKAIALLIKLALPNLP